MEAAVDTIKQLRKSANSIKSLFEERVPLWEGDKRHYDKVGAGFNLDNRFNSCSPATVAFSSWEGTYGSSSCSSRCTIDAKLFQSHLIKYLNRDPKEVMLWIANSIEQEAATHKEKAESELRQQLKALEQLTNNPASTEANH